MTTRLPEISRILERQEVEVHWKTRVPRILGIDTTARAIMALDGWRDIASAPKDGTTILVWRRVGAWSVIGHARWENVCGVAGWISHGFSDCPGNLGLAFPTHWMPLPPAPEPQS